MVSFQLPAILSKSTSSIFRAFHPHSSIYHFHKFLSRTAHFLFAPLPQVIVLCRNASECTRCWFEPGQGARNLVHPASSPLSPEPHPKAGRTRRSTHPFIETFSCMGALEETAPSITCCMVSHYGKPSHTRSGSAKPSSFNAALGTVIELLQKVNKAVIYFPYSCSGFSNKHNHKHHNRELSFEIFETYIDSGSCPGGKRIIRGFCD